MKKNEIHVWPQPIRLHEGELSVGAVIEKDPGNRKELWFKVPERFQEYICETCDPFAACLMYMAMSESRDLLIHGQVSPSLISHLYEYQQVWTAWLPLMFQKIDIRCEKLQEMDISRPDRSAICTFSGGVDSAFTAYRHATGIGTEIRRPLKAALMVQGFDIPLDQTEMFDNAVNRSSKMTGSLGLELITLKTNYLSLDINWSKSFGSALAACMMIFQKKFSEGLISQGVAYFYYKYMVEGSNPLTDAMLSSSSFCIVPDGAGYRRTDKILLMNDWPEMRRYLRVCWRGESKDRNCGVCEKCIRNILSFRVLGLGLPECFDRDVTDKMIRSLAPLKEIIIQCGYENILKLADKNNITDSWVHALKVCIHKNRRRRWRKLIAYLKDLPVYMRNPGNTFRRLLGYRS